MTTEAARTTLESEFLPAIQALHRQIRDAVWQACRERSTVELSQVAADDAGDTIYALDRISEELLVEALAELATRVGGIVLVAEGVHAGRLVLPRGSDASEASYVVIVDPIDGTRGLMYQKRSGWVLTGVARNRPGVVRLSDIELAIQTEIPLVKQYLADELWALRGAGARGRRVNLLTGEAAQLALGPSRAATIEHGYAMLSRFFPGGRDVLGAVDDELVAALLGPTQPGKAACFEDQYASSGGQLYELMVGHDRFNADLRPLLAGLLAERGQASGLCCHPYDVCTLLIAEELGVLVTAPGGAALDAPLAVEPDVAWVGYANAALKARIEPPLNAVLGRRGLLQPPP